MNNPIALLRGQLDNQVNGNTKEKDSSTVDKERLKEQLESMHKGWLEHPNTLQLMNDLLVANIEVHLRAYNFVHDHPDKANPFLPKAAVLSKLIDCIKNNTPYN